MPIKVEDVVVGRTYRGKQGRPRFVVYIGPYGGIDNDVCYRLPNGTAKWALPATFARWAQSVVEEGEVKGE